MCVPRAFDLTHVGDIPVLVNSQSLKTDRDALQMDLDQQLHDAGIFQCCGTSVIVDPGSVRHPRAFGCQVLPRSQRDISCIPAMSLLAKSLVQARAVHGVSEQMCMATTEERR